MKLKASLHIHTDKDPREGSLLAYSPTELLARAIKDGFKVLAITHHQGFFYDKNLARQAEEQGVIIFSGIELELSEGRRRPHVVVLNALSDIARVTSLADLRAYKLKHPDIFILAAHPLSDWRFSLGRHLLLANLDLFDALEETWFYGRLINPNQQVRRIARQANKPTVATADMHELKFLNKSYTTIESKFDKTAIIAALKAGRLTNYSLRQTLFVRVWFIVKMLSKQFIFLTIPRMFSKTVTSDK